MPNFEGSLPDARPVDGETALFFFENSIDLLALISGKGWLSAANGAWTSATGWSVEELLGRPFLDFLHPDDHQRARASRLETLGGDVTETHFRLLTKDDRWIWLKSRGRLCPTGEVAAVMRDVTEEREREAALLDAQRARELLREAAGVGSWRLHPTEGYTWSPELAALSPHLSDLQDPEQFRAQVHPDDLEMISDLRRRGVLHGEAATYEIRFRGADGAWRHFRNHHQARPLPDGTHELYGIAQDVTELVAARDAARTGEAQAQALIEAAPFAVALFDREHRYRVVSPLWAELFDVAPDQIGVALENRPTAPPVFIADVDRALAGESTAPFNYEWTDPKGQDHVLRWVMRPHHGPDGQVVGAVAYVDDIQAFQKARAEAESSAARLRMALTAAKAGVLEIDYTAQTFWASPEFDRLVGRMMTYADVTKHLWPIIDPADNPTLQALQSWWQAGALGGVDVQIRRPSGERRWVRMYAELTVDEADRPTRLSGLMLDITVAKEQELALIEAERRAQAAGEAKAQFLANMSHEIRTPMNGVLGVLHLLREETLTPDGRGLLEEATACGRMLAELLNDVIDFSRIEAGRLELHPEPVDVAAVVAGAARLLRAEAEGKALKLLVETPPTLWAAADPVRLRQALFNLVGNAVKFTSDGEVRVRLLRSAPGRLQFEVHDTGPGIAPEDQAKLFARFQQVDGSSTRKHGGSGLGLAITRRLAELMDGVVDVESTPGRGSCFTLEIAAPDADPVADPVAAAAGALDGLRVLLVEDNAVNRLVIGKMLESLGADVAMAEDGAQGVEAALIGGFDLILMDVQMPVMDGVEAVGCIRRSSGPAAATPIIALTANALSHQAEQYRAAGMDGVVSKPVSPAALLAEIGRLAAGADLVEAAA